MVKKTKELELLQELKSFTRIKSWDIATGLNITGSWLSHLITEKNWISKKVAKWINHFNYTETETKDNFEVTLTIKKLWEVQK